MLDDELLYVPLVILTRELEAVKGISFRVKKGEAFALPGPNGAGKTTTVRMPTTLTSVTSRDAYANGLDVKMERLAVKRRGQLALHGKTLRGIRGKGGGADKRVQASSGEKVQKLSTVFKRRVTIVSALIHEPEILFLDEPTNGLDVRSAKAVRGLIRSLNRQGMTVFITTHNMVEAETIPQRIAIMKAGKIVAEGKRNELARLVGKSIIVRLSVEPLTSSLIKALERFKPTFDEGSLVFNVEDVNALLETLMALRKKLNFRVKSLCTELPEIEDVFVELTGGCPWRGCPLWRFWP